MELKKIVIWRYSKLSNHQVSTKTENSNGAPQNASSESGQDTTWAQEKENLHNLLLKALDRTIFQELKSEELDARLRPQIFKFIEKNISSEFSEQTSRMAEELQNELIGLGPLQSLIHDKSISEIMVNGIENIYVEKSGNIQPTGIRFRSEEHLRLIIDQIVGHIGRRVDKKTPMVDARLPDGSRVNIIIPPAALSGSTITIRRFLHNKLDANDLIQFGSISQDMLTFLKAAIGGAMNIVVSGRTGSGKTTLLNMLSGYIPSQERIVTVEDSAELSLQQEHVITLETVQADRDGNHGVTIRDLVKNSLRMRPDRIIVGECRGDEALDMLQAMNTGHDGSMTTIHANTPRDALSRIATMFMMAGYDIPDRVIKQHIASAIDMIVQIDRLTDGSRKVTQITEITGMEGDVITMQDIYELDWKIDENGVVTGHHKCMGIRPKSADKLKALGQILPDFHESAIESVAPKPSEESNEIFRSNDEAVLKNR